MTIVDAPRGPVLQILVEVSAPMLRVLSEADVVAETEALVVTAMRELLRELGVPGSAAARILPADGDLRDDQPLRLTVDDRRCRYSMRSVRRAAEYLLGKTLDPVDDWFARVSGDGALLGRILVSICAEAVSECAGVLAGPDQVDAYREGLFGADADAAARWSGPALRGVLSEVLDLRLSVADRDRVGRVLAAAGQDPGAGREALITALCTGVLEIELGSGYLRAMTDTPENDEFDQGLFGFLRAGLFRELGLSLPAFRIVREENLAPTGIRFRVNALHTGPLLGVPPSHVLVNDLAVRLAADGVDAEPATDPATGQSAALVGVDSAADLERDGWTTCTPLGFLLLAMAATLRQHARCLVDTTATDSLLERLRPIFPHLVGVASTCVPSWRLTGLLRDLVGEGVSARDLRRILNHLIEVAGHAAEDLELTPSMRRALRRQITHQHTKGTNTLVGYLVGPDVETLLARRAPATEPELDRVAAAIAIELGSLPRTTSVPALLTVREARAALARLTHAEFPHVSVLAFDELTDSVVVQPIARVSLK